MDQERIRKRAKLLKATQNVSYKELAEYLEISTSTMYNWLPLMCLCLPSSVQFAIHRQVPLASL